MAPSEAAILLSSAAQWGAAAVDENGHNVRVGRASIHLFARRP
jgi:hypothetical protein